MNLPSKRTLETAFPGKGAILRALLESPEAVNNHPAVVEWVNQCHSLPRMAEKRMVAINAELEGFGVEYARGNKSPSFNYVNMGDVYTTTIVRFQNGRYRVSDMGAIIERGSYL